MMFGKRWPTRVVFIRNGDEATMPVDLGFDAVTIGLGDHEVRIPAGETRYIAWPDGVDQWTYNGAPGPKQRFWRPSRMTVDLIARIRAAIDDHELAANQCVEKNWRIDGANSCQVYVRREDYSNRTIAWCGNGYEDDFSNVIHIAANDPAHVLRQVAAHRKILDLHSPYDEAYPEWADSDIPNRRCIGCGFDGSEDAMVDDVNNCPTLLALAEGYGIEVSDV